MTFKRYQNELIILATICFMLLAYIYKDSNSSDLDAVKNKEKISATQADEIISLKKQWSSPDLSKKILKLKEGISVERVKHFTLKGKKLTASFRELSAKEMNAVIVKLENIAVQIVELKVTQADKKYKMEIKCKW